MEVKLSTEEELVLKEANQVWRMVNSRGWQQVFRPWLEVKLNQSFPDPAKFTKEEEFVYAAKVTSVFKKVVAEILGWADQEVATAKALEAKKEGKVVDKFKIGGEENG